MINKDNLNGLWAVLAGMLIFKATTYISQVENIIKDYPIVVVIVGFLLFFNKGH